MIYTLTIHEQDFGRLIGLLDNPNGNEAAAYLLCNKSVTKAETRFIVKDVLEIPAIEIMRSSRSSVSILSKSYVKAFAKSDRENKSLFLVHSHPKGSQNFSKQDDIEEREFFRTGYIRSPKNTHGSLIVEDVKSPFLLGRVWLNEAKNMKLEKIRIVGKKFKVFSSTRASRVPLWADRQVEAFGADFQKLLKTLCVGIVGAGGTGSSVCEQVIRMGVGRLIVIDEQNLEDTNVTRIYGTGLKDVGKSKSFLIKRMARRIGTGTTITSINGSVCDLKHAKKLRECDLIFSCTDDMLGRLILNHLALYYYIPVVDMAVSIDSTGGKIRDITGRITVLMAGNACLICRKRINQAILRAEVLNRINPAEYKKQVKERYVRELPQRDPSVIMFTTNIASRAVVEFVSMLTGFMGEDWTATEILERFHETDFSIRTGKNSFQGIEGCSCFNNGKWGLADTNKFLGRLW